LAHLGAGIPTAFRCNVEGNDEFCLSIDSGGNVVHVRMTRDNEVLYLEADVVGFEQALLSGELSQAALLANSWKGFFRLRPRSLRRGLVVVLGTPIDSLDSHDLQKLLLQIATMAAAGARDRLGQCLELRSLADVAAGGGYVS
jgi:hypothetical protein